MRVLTISFNFFVDNFLEKQESVTRELITHEKNFIKKTYQRPRNIFWGEYGGLDLYDEDLKKIYTIYHEYI